MADIKTTVDSLPEKDIFPVLPAVDSSVDPVVTVEQIKAVVADLAQPTKHGHALHRIARNHGVGLPLVRQIEKAFHERRAALLAQKAPEPEEV